MLIFKTSKGDVKIELYADKAPETVKNFMTYVNEGFFNGTIFHRVIKNFMVQGGGFDTGFKEKANHASIKNEADNGLSNKRGAIAMARTMEPHSAGSQFFINLVDNDYLDFQSATPRGYGYCVFGQVVEGMDVMDAIAKVKTGRRGMHDDVPVENVVVNSVEVVE
ncbi:MAG: peptidylprolyl isomerase [Victivallaceae bacterium]